MSKYFENFSLIRYNDSLAINITQRAAFTSQLFGDNFSFYPYQVKNGMRAEQVAEKYYGDPHLVWLVYFSNNIVDPYHEWTMDEQTFFAHLTAKYGSVEASRNKIVSYRVNWYEDSREIDKNAYNALPMGEKKYWEPQLDINNRPLFYRRKELDFISVAQDGDGNVTLSVPMAEASYWTPVTAFEIEEEENVKKSHIRLLDSRLAQTAASNLRKLLEE